MKYSLTEDSRRQLIDKSKSSFKGTQRINRRLKSKFSNSVKEFNKIDMDKLFKTDILDVQVPITGETNNYLVQIAMGGVLRQLAKDNRGTIDFALITQSLLKVFSEAKNVYIACSCPDWKYRFQYWATVNNFNSGNPQYSNGKKIRNPNDKLGSACKHVLLVLSNSSWMVKVASVLNNYINFMKANKPKLYADKMYPRLYGKPYKGDVQLGLEPETDLDTKQDTIDISNEIGKKSGQFKKGNTQGIRFAKEEPDEGSEPLLHK